ncbi:hypothetical protein BDW59DRAFT_152516 [Aspergillus cavernicola]|uniref:Zn(2)-C6 fungal-type domain-containing protein n=1 Tax=Aspergillus cavernicola TaxID=176166 RepID=A0ABR4HQF5_9EURO
MPQRANTRSRAGCLTCRQRHVRCDEQRPSCQTCLASKRSCNYSPTVIPLRDRRMLQRNALPPGQEAPWELMNTPGMTGRKLAASTAMDPFDTLPVKMPFKSRELYHYFYQTGAAFAAAPSDPKDDCIALATLDEHALRSTILIAGIHYSWNTGNLQAYESAFLFHKVESIRIINTWLKVSDSKTFVVCVRQILTIALAEACLGNLTTAETHLNGIMALFDSRGQVDGASGSIDDIEGELANRYLLLTSCFVLCLKSRLDDFILFRAAQGIDPNHDGSSAEALKLMNLWHGMEYGGLDTRLRAMRMFPYFFSLPPMNRRPKMVDALPIIDCLRTITETVDQIRINPTPEHIDRVWNEGGPTKLLLVLVTSHVSSFAKDDENLDPAGNEKLSQPLLRSSWSGIVATAELYMHSVLNIINAGEPIECRLLYRILLIMKQDIDQTRDDLSGDHGSLRQSLWFWKVFTGALALATSQHRHIAIDMKTVGPSEKCSCETDLEGLYEWFRNCARAWSAVTETTNWKDVEPVLAIVAWPTVLSQDGNDYAANAWAQAILEDTR